jgi:hypothetical protein
MGMQDIAVYERAVVRWLHDDCFWVIGAPSWSIARKLVEMALKFMKKYFPHVPCGATTGTAIGEMVDDRLNIKGDTLGDVITLIDAHLKLHPGT